MKEGKESGHVSQNNEDQKSKNASILDSIYSNESTADNAFDRYFGEFLPGFTNKKNDNEETSRKGETSEARLVELKGLGVYYSADGTRLGQIGDNTQVRVVKENYVEPARVAFIVMKEAGHKNYADELFQYSTSTGMEEGELFVRAFMSTIKQTENNGVDKLNYNDKHMEGKKVPTFTDKTYKDAPQDYADHPYRGKSGGTAAGAFQILIDTYDRYRRIYPNDVPDFGPKGQEAIVLGIFSRTGALNDIKIGDLKSAIAKLTKAPMFSSLPGGGEERGMTQTKVETLFKANVVLELNKKTDLVIPQGQTLKNIPND